ncbi:transposase family protein [Pontibacter mangrovi]|uniref:Transposase family protein n=1 Tax=Pontibacter mangrovi TaxID=2589816 RepID=A0A501W250_9BACT|nr:transposase family protein [Pontibacter mangrovi]TPE39726.1 transposase family protein [Pontibacter mangrovi]
METTLLLPAEFDVLGTCVCQGSVTIHLIFTAPVGLCPLCRCPSSRLHSHYRRTLADLPLCGKQVRLQLYSRKFFCDTAG